MYETGKEPTEPPDPAPETTVSVTLNLKNIESRKTIGETKEEI